MSEQIKLNKKLLHYVFSNEDFSNKKELKKALCEDNENLKKYFTNSYRILEYADVIINEKLNPKLKGIYTITNINVFVDILINILQEYKKAKDIFDEYLKKAKIIRKRYASQKEYLDAIEYVKRIDEGKWMKNLELVIQDLYARFVYAKQKENKEKLNKEKINKPNGENYNLSKDLPVKKQTTLELAFREILHNILHDTDNKIEEQVIRKVVSRYYYENEKYNEKERGAEKYSKKNPTKLINTRIKERQENAITNTKNTLITALIDLGLISVQNNDIPSEIGKNDKTNNRVFERLHIRETDWMMNAKTKHDSINSLIGGISDMSNVSPENKELVRFIFNYMG